jgi:4a-hydroxytetrahydrobiopterin dehydratase
MSTKEPLYDSTTIANHLAALPGWQVADNWLVREYPTSGWRVTMMVVNAIAFVAEAANHHPDLEVHWGSVTVRLQTHSAGGITDKDLQLAARIHATVSWRPEDGFPGLEGPAKEWIKT